MEKDRIISNKYILVEKLDEEKQMHMARKLAQVVLKSLYRLEANKKTAQQQLSRRINRGKA
jgi:hypothetical protein